MKLKTPERCFYGFIHLLHTGVGDGGGGAETGNIYLKLVKLEFSVITSICTAPIGLSFS